MYTVFVPAGAMIRICTGKSEVFIAASADVDVDVYAWFVHFAPTRCERSSFGPVIPNCENSCHRVPRDKNTESAKGGASHRNPDPVA